MTDPTPSSGAKRRRPAESEYELAARAVLEADLGCTLVRVEATFGSEFPDYRTPTGDRVIEVKRLTSERFHAADAACAREATYVHDDRLTGRWIVPIMLVDLAIVLPRLGNAPFFGNVLPPRVKNLAMDLVEHFAILEKHQVSGHFDRTPTQHTPNELVAARQAIVNRIGHNWYVRSRDVDGDGPGDVLLVTAREDIRTGMADTLVNRLDRWFTSPNCNNLCKSLSHDPPGTERIAFLVFDPITEPEIDSARQQGTAFCPTRTPALPPEVDVVWILAGPVACRFDPTGGWTVRTAPTPAVVP